MAPDLSGGLGNSPPSAKSKHVLKKGPWTTSEDVVLVEYVKKHGEGNWNAVQRNSGLMRCGKSCRLRWANHLRPNLKKGAFGPEEEKLIIDLHAKLGNKWARMAAQLPGRTDNEIKNYWNTRLKRRQRAGLPIYPQQTLHQLNSSSTSLSSRLASSRPSNTNPLPFYDAFASRPLISPLHNQLKLYDGNTGGGGGLALSFSSSPFFNRGTPSPLPVPSMLQYNALDYGNEAGGSGMGVLGLPSIQSSVVTPAASSSDFAMGPASSDEYEVELSVGGYGKSGLLEDLLGESRALACHDKTEEQAFQGTITPASEEGNNAIDDDLLDLLDNFPLSVPIPDWDEVHGSEPPRLTEGTTQSQPNIARYNPVANSPVAANQDYWSFDSCLWNNMPSIY